MRLELFALSALMVMLLALTACQAAEQLEATEPTLEVTLTEDVGLPATEEPPTREPTPVPPTPEPTPELVAAYEPVFEPTDCWWTLPESQPVECGYLVVPENRGDPDSPSIRIATAILRHPGGNPESDPIVYIHGGPGGGFMQVLDLEFETLTEFFETNRDVIYFDQRGNGLSEPSFNCPDFATALGDLFDYTLDSEQLTNSEAQDHLLGELVECGEAWGQTVDLSTYDSPTTAADVNDLRIALGYDQINVYAESYGPRVAQSLMRDYPDTVRSAVLDAAMSTYAPLEYFPRKHGGMLSHLFELCAADEACNTAFPDLRNVWLETLDEVDQNPVSLKGSFPLTGEAFDFLVDDGMLATALFFLSYQDDALPAIPACIYATHEGDYACLEGALGRVIIRAFLANWGNLLNVTCRERTPISRVEDFEAVLEAYPEVKSFWEDNLFIPKRTLFNESLCEAWGGGVVPESEHDPVVSSIPTLLVLGDTDPASIMEESMGIAETLENHFGPYSYPFLSHVVFGAHECPTSMVTAFINDPTAEPDASCIAEMGADFDSPGEGGEIALEPFTNEDMGYSTLIPTGWEEMIPGVYSRGNPALDPTILAQLSSPNETAEEFLSEILANLGVAALPETPVRVMDSDALSWSLYLVSGDPTTAVALAESETTTYIVVLKAAGDEFDALADELLVPAIMAFTPTNQYGMTPFTSSDESLSFVYPDGWPVEQTGPGRVILANSDDGMTRFENGALQNGDVRISITLVPANMLADFGLHMGNTAEEALQFIPDSGLFVTEQEDTQVGEIQSIELGNSHSAAQVGISTADEEGVLITEMQSDQVIAFISVVAPTGEYANFEEPVRNIADSISVSVTANEMIALIMSSAQE
jgi:pimeloyl-ACP methyl ester carboxylesterase